MIYFGCAALVILYFCLYLLFGKLFFFVCEKIKFGGQDASLGMEQLLIGYFVYHLCFYVFGVPLKLLGASLTLLTVCWGIVLMAGILWAVMAYKKGNLPLGRRLFLPRRYLFLYGIVLFLLVSLMNVNMQTGALWDESHYVGEVTTSIYTDSLSGYDVYTGKRTRELDEEYLLEITETHSAVMCRIFGIAPSIEVRTVRATVNILLFYLLVILLGQRLFETAGDDKRQQKAALFFCIFVGLDLFSYNLHTRAQILLYRAFEGKAILANIILFSMFYFFLRIYRRQEENDRWAAMFVVIAASFGLNMTSLILVPALYGALMLPFLLSGRRWGLIKKMTICLLPWVPELVFYLALH